MGRAVRTPVALHFSDAQLLAMQNECRDKFGASRIQAVRRYLRGDRDHDIARDLGHKPDWVRRVVRDYNVRGVDAFKDGRAGNHGKPLLDAEAFAELRHAVEEELPPGGGLWNSPKVAAWIGKRLGKKVYRMEGWKYLQRLEYSKKVPRPAHADKDQEACEDFQKKGFKIRSGR